MEGCTVSNQTLRSVNLRQRSGAIVIAVERADTGELSFNPDPGVVLNPGDVLVGVGLPGQLERLVSLCTG
jgi:K+/H+ antiporter YhaU regulatory subunit KhtT